MANGYAKYSGLGGSGGGGGSGVTSLNGETGAVSLVAGTGITVTPAGSNITIAATGSGGGTVTSVSVVSANGLAGSVATPTSTPAITLSTTITGLLQGNGTAISAATTGNLTDAGTDGITVTGGTGAVLGSGTSLSQHVADTTHNGYLSSTDWNTFNGKQASGSYITALTGDVTASGPGSAAATLTATTNSTLTTLSALSLPGSQVTGNISGNAANITATSNSTLTTLSALSLPGSQVTGNISGNAANITAASNSTLTTLSSLSLPTSQLSGNISLTTQVSGVLPIANGGTDNGSLGVTAGGVIYTDGTKLQNVGAGTSGQVLQSNGASAPTWHTPAAAGNFGKALYSGGFQNGSGSIYWSTTTNAQVDFTPNGTPTLTANFNSSFGTVSAAASTLPGITIASAPATGTLKITVSSSAAYTTSDSGSFYLTDGSGTLINAASSRQSATNSVTPFCITGFYNVVASTSYTFKVQGSVSSGTLFIGGSSGDPYILDFAVEYVA